MLFIRGNIVHVVSAGKEVNVKLEKKVAPVPNTKSWRHIGDEEVELHTLYLTLDGGKFSAVHFSCFAPREGFLVFLLITSLYNKQHTSIVYSFTAFV